jgi:insertion element IS1 protein InsB
MECKFCSGKCNKAGKQKSGLQRYYCRGCKKYQQSNYRYFAYKKETASLIPSLVCESVRMRGIGRLLKIGLSTVIRKIRLIASGISKPAIPVKQISFELDEVRTYVRKKENQYWIAYALCSKTKKVIDFTVGKRSKRVLRSIVNTLLLSNVQTIKTDKLNIYQSLIPAERHISNAYNINHIERNNLNLRTHLKRLSRRTICFSKSLIMLEACLKIYFWKDADKKATSHKPGKWPAPLGLNE